MIVIALAVTLSSPGLAANKEALAQCDIIRNLCEITVRKKNEVISAQDRAISLQESRIKDLYKEKQGTGILGVIIGAVATAIIIRTTNTGE